MDRSISANLPESVQYGRQDDPHHMEYDRREGHYKMRRFHIHPSYEVFYLFSGERGFFIKDRTYTIRAGDLVLIDSNEVHKSLDVGVPNHDRLVMYYDREFFERYYPNETPLLLSPFRESRVLRLNMKERIRIEAIFESYFSELLGASPGYELMLRHLAAELLLQSSRLATEKKDMLIEGMSPIQKKMKDIVQYINRHYDQTLRLTDIARQFYISTSHLSRIFKQSTGFSFTDYINILRIREAQRLLYESNHSITDISGQVGFDNFSHFGKMFKKISYVSPSNYRHQKKFRQ